MRDGLQLTDNDNVEALRQVDPDPRKHANDLAFPEQHPAELLQEFEKVTSIGARTALAAAASLLTPILVVLFYLGAKLLSKLVGPLLQRGRYYPFMPVVSLATVGVLAAALLWQAARGGAVVAP